MKKIKEIREYSYQKIDAFTSDYSLGNPAACIYLDKQQMLTEDEMQEIASQHKGFASEVVFLRKDLQGSLHLTYYSSECEVDFCGHGTIACMYSYIKNTPYLHNIKEITVLTNKKGSITVYNEITSEDAVYITAPKPIYLGTSLTADIVGKNLGIDSKNINSQRPIDLIDAGLRTLIVPIKKLSTEIKILPNQKELEEFCNDNDIDIILCYSEEASKKQMKAHTRVFAPKFGYLEDKATGSGNSAFGYYMLKNNMWDGEKITIEQGGEDITYNHVKLAVRDEHVIFGGMATTRIKGNYCI